MSIDAEAAEVKAAGGVVWRRGAGGVEIVVVHRPRYDDWSLPKGKLDPGESWEQAALREVLEEVGLRCVLGAELPPVSYTDRKDRLKVVRYWLMQPEEDLTFVPNDEVDVMRWAGLEEAQGLLTYPRDGDVLGTVEAHLPVPDDDAGVKVV